MAVKLKLSKSRKGARLTPAAVRLMVAAVLVVATLALGVFAWYYVKYQKIVDRRMSGRIFSNAAKIYAAPKEIRLGQSVTSQEIAAQLVRAGYTDKGDSRIGTYRMLSGGIEITPGPESYHNREGALVRITNGKVDRIATLEGKTQDLSAYELEPQLVTALFEGEQRSKRRLISYNDIPKVMVDAVLAIEDRRFFQHGGVNYFRLAEAALIDLRSGRKQQGASTLTMQIARGFFLTPQKTITRKLSEMLIAVQLEQRFSKQQIFELYANSVYMGQRGSFTVSGFGEASQAYFGKDIKSLTLPEAALLAGMIQLPNAYNPYKNPERALERRNLVLDSMVETGAIQRKEAERAKATPLKLAPPNVDATDAPYFVDLVKDTLTQRYNERDLNENALRIYSTLDPDLQRAAAEAVQAGMKLVDEQVTKLRTKRLKVGAGKAAKTETKVAPGPQAQVALVAMDPHTGEILALVGGRNYGMSQLNHAVAKRPTGSIFKPFVYAAAINTALTNPQAAFTPASMVDDSPTTFAFGDQIYEPRNYKEEYHGPVSARYALALSLNNATVKVAEQVGYDSVAELAKAAGITSVKATPAMALGAYDASPLEMAGAYTIFANGGTRISPVLVKSLRDSQGNMIEDFNPEKKDVLDPRVAAVMTNMMEGVVNFGTAFPVRARGFTAPAAGKTGTSHDGWFAGYTTNLLCIVWIGFDDYSDLRLSGAVTAAPIWAEFMKRAVQMPQYRDAQAFPQPPGVVEVTLDKVTNRLATSTCPDDYTAEFIAGTEPHDTCDQSDQRGFFSRIFGLGAKPVPPVSNAPQPPGTQAQPQAQSAQPPPEKKKGFFGKIFGVFTGGDDKKDKKDENKQPPPAPPPR
ncbi:MAG TPA: PBP1A family penicillin-binding protein [Terriglobales bacterium]|nr:PBP1A family penicillin-binding protein [Terriglobales bacterium]